MDAIVSRMLRLLSTGDPDSQNCALSTLASVAAAAGPAFRQHAASVLPLLGRYMQVRWTLAFPTVCSPLRDLPWPRSAASLPSFSLLSCISQVNGGAVGLCVACAQ
jgi:hypothetical protein